MRRLALIIALVLFAACDREPPTQIVVVVDSDLRVPDQVSYVVITTRDADDHRVDSIEISLDNDPVSPVRSRFPFSFTVVPRSGGEAGPITVSLDASNSSRSVAFTRSATTSFAHGRTLLLRMRLASRCLSEAASCGAGETCTENGCASATISPDDLTEIVPGTELSDAGPSDGAVDAGPPADAAVVPTRCESPYTSVALGGDVQPFTHACGLSVAGAVFCWGSNSREQLGGPGGAQLRPTYVALPRPIHAITSGSEAACAIDDEQAARCWGDNGAGQLGVGDTAAHEGPQPVMGAISWSQISVGHRHACGVDTTGRLYCWGDGAGGRLGLGDEAAHTTPVQVGATSGWRQVAAGVDHTCAIRAGELHCWGVGARDQLGDGGTAGSLTPERIGTDADWTDIDVGDGFACGVRGSGVLFCWGTSSDGALGVGDAMPRSTPTAVTLPSVTDVDVGPEHVCAVAAGHLYCWGANGFGQLGVGPDDRTPRSMPTEVMASGVTWRSVSASAEATSCGVDDGGIAYCWGLDSQGQLGIGSADDVRVPTPLCP